MERSESETIECIGVVECDVERGVEEREESELCVIRPRGENF